MNYVHLHVHSPFSFLDGASRIEDLVQKAAALEMPALAVTDHNNVAAGIKFAHAARAAGIKAIQGAEISMEDGTHLTLLARNNSGYASLCNLLTRAHLSHERGQAACKREDLESLNDVVVLSGCRKSRLSTLLLYGYYREAAELLKQYQRIVGKENFFIELQDTLLPGNARLNRLLIQLSDDYDVKTVASNNVHYADKQDFIIHDLLCCVRTLTRVQEVHPLRPLNAENDLKTPAEMQDLFSFCPSALENTWQLARECEPVFASNSLHFPPFPQTKQQDPVAYLRFLTFNGARERYGKKIPATVLQRLEHELNIIAQMGYAEYFLLVWDLVCFARQQGIQYAGRGSAADSLTAYCLRITEVDSLARGLLFERFMNPERMGLPDIDIDFEARHRHRVIDYVYQKYGHHRVARVATYNTFQARSAIRDIGKALGFPAEEIKEINHRLPYTQADNIRNVLSYLPELQDSLLHEQRFQFLLTVCEKIAGFPRFPGMHPGGLVISDIPLLTLTPLQRSALGPLMTQFDKDDVEKLGLIKLDLLALQTLSVVHEASEQIQKQDADFDYEKFPDDVASYQRSREETIGVFQLEFCQCALRHARALKTLRISSPVALIRPGLLKETWWIHIGSTPCQEKVSYLHPCWNLFWTKLMV